MEGGNHMKAFYREEDQHRGEEMLCLSRIESKLDEQESKINKYEPQQSIYCLVYGSTFRA